jgi:hypothetical protein
MNTSSFILVIKINKIKIKINLFKIVFLKKSLQRVFTRFSHEKKEKKYFSKSFLSDDHKLKNKEIWEYFKFCFLIRVGKIKNRNNIV